MAKNDVALRVNDVSICFNLSKKKLIILKNYL